MQQKTITADPRILLDRIHAEFPDIRWETYEFNDDGWDHEVLLLDKRLVFRFPNDQEYLNYLHNEVQVLEYLAPRVRVRIPRYTHVAQDGSFAGYPYVRGESLKVALFNSLTPEEKASFAAQLGGFLTALHQERKEGSALDFIADTDMAEAQMEIWSTAKERLPAMLTPEEYAAAEAILIQTDQLIASQPPKALIHGDIYPAHLLWDKKDASLGVIDFSDANWGDPAFDFAEIHEYGAELVVQVYAAYQGPKDETFLERAWAYQQWVGVFLMTDHFHYGKTSFEDARETFDRCRLGRR